MSFAVLAKVRIWYVINHVSGRGHKAERFSQLAVKGKYREALARMEKLDQETLRTLKHYHYWIASMGLLKLQRHLHR